MNVISREDAFEMWRLLAGGVAIRGVALALGLSKPTVLRHVFLFGEAAKDAYCGNIEDGCDDGIEPAVYDAWEVSMKKITLAGWKFRPVSLQAEEDARRFYVAKAKEAKSKQMLGRAVAIRVAHAGLIDFDGKSPLALQAGLIREAWHPDVVAEMALDPGMGYVEMAREEYGDAP